MNSRVLWLESCRDLETHDYKHESAYAVLKEILAHEIGHAVGIKWVKGATNLKFTIDQSCAKNCTPHRAQYELFVNFVYLQTPERRKDDNALWVCSVLREGPVHRRTWLSRYEDDNEILQWTQAQTLPSSIWLDSHTIFHLGRGQINQSGSIIKRIV